MPHGHSSPFVPGHRCRPTFGTRHAPGHVGIVTGHDTMIDAPYKGQVVREETFSGSTNVVGFTRP